MASHSLGGQRSLEIIEAPDRTIKRLSPVQVWIMRHALGDVDRWHEIPPSRHVLRLAQRLSLRGLLDVSRDGLRVRYRPLARAEIVSTNYAGALHTRVARNGFGYAD
jgi:hypothetical protein